MFVLTADEADLINLDQYEEIMIGIDGTVFARGQNSRFTLIGKYESEERAKQVLLSIAESMKEGIKLIQMTEK